MVPDVRTVLEIGGRTQNHYPEGRRVVDFAMNSVCALALSVPGSPGYRWSAIESLETAAAPVNLVIAVGCVRRIRYDPQAANGHSAEDITRGLEASPGRNYLNNVGKGKDIHPPVVFQGGAAANVWALRL